MQVAASRCSRALFRVFAFAVGVLLYGVFFPVAAHAAVVTWDGGGGVDTNWNTCANWSGNTCPTSADVATFDATSTNNAAINVDINVLGLDINTGYTGTITQGTGINLTIGNSDYAQDAGTFTGSSGAMTISDSFSLAGGTFTAPSGTTTVPGSFTHTLGGTFSHNNGTFAFTGAAATINVATTETFYNLQFNANDGVAKTITSGDTLVVTNAATLTNGLFTSGTLDIDGTLTVDSTWDGGSGILTITGIGTQTISIPGSLSTYIASTVTLNAANYTLTGSGGGTLPFSILNVQAGTFDASGYTVTHGSTTTVSGGTYTAGTGTKTFTGGFTLSSGTFNGNTATLDYNSGFTISGGTYNATSGTMYASAGWTHTAGGTFNHNNGSVVMDGGAWTADVATTETFYNLQMNGTADSTSRTITSGDTLVVTNNAQLTNGLFATGTLDIEGTMTVDSTWDGGNGILTITGIGTQTISIPGSLSTYIANTVTLNATNYTLTGSGGGTLPFSIVNVQAGTLDVSGYTVTHGNTTTVSGGTYTAGTGTKTFTGAFTLSSGTFNGNTATLDYNSGFTISGGTYNATSGTMYASAGWTHTAGGTFNHNNGSVVMDGGSWTADVATTETFYNLQLNGTADGSTKTITSGDTLVVSGTAQLTNGGIATGTLDIDGPMTIDSTWDGPGGIITITGTGTQTVSIPGSLLARIASTVTLNGENYTLNGSGGSGTLYFNALNVTTGTFDASGYDVSISGNLAITTGTMTCGSGTKTITGTVTLSGGTFNGGSSTVDIGSTFQLNSGTFNASTGTMYYGSTFTVNPVTGFNHLNGTSVFDGGTVTITPNSTGAGSLDFGSVQFNATNATTKTIATGDTMVVTGTLTLTEGSIITGTLEARGDISAASTLDTLTAPLNITGSATQNVTLTSAESLLNSDITVNKSGGAVVLQSGMTLDASNQDLTVQEGVFDLNGQALTVNGTSGKVIIENGGTLRLQGGETITANATYPQLDVGSTVTYNGTSGPYTLKNYSYQHLTIAGGASSVFNLPGILSVAGNTTITTGILSQNGYALTVTGTFSNDGTLRRLQSETFTGTMDVNSGTVEYAGDGDGTGESVTIADFGVTDYYHLRINDANVTKDTFTLGGNVVTAGLLQVTSGTFAPSTYTVSSAGITVDGGTVSSGSGAMTLTGSTGVTISGGTFTATSNTITVSGPWTHTAGGTFTHNSGTVAFTGSSATIDVASTETFNALTINMTDANTLTVASGDTLIADGVLTLTNGTWGTGNVRAQGNVVVASTWDASGTGTLQVQGSGTQTLDLTGATGALDNPVAIDKSGGSLTLASAYTMDAAGADFTLTNGTFSTGNYAVTTSSGSDIALNGGTWNSGSSTLTIGGLFTVAGGTYNGDTSAPTFSGGLTMTSGAISASTGTTTITGDYTHTVGGTFTHNSGTVAFTGNSATVDVATTETFGAVTVNKTGGQTMTVGSGDTLVATGVLTLSDGAFATGSLTAQGNVVVGLGWDAAGAGTLNVTGAGVQTFDASAGVGLLDNPVNVNKSGGSLTLASAYTLDHANADLTVTLGTFSTGGYALTTSSGSDIVVAGGTFNAGASTLTLAGTISVNSGTFNANTSTGAYSGAVAIAGGTYNGNDSTPTFSSTFAISSGAYNGSSNGDTFSGGLTISGGTFTASDATTTVSSTWTHTGGGTFAHNSGTVAFTGAASSIDVATNETFSSLTMSKNNAATLTITSGDSLIAVGTLTLTNGATGTGTLEAQGAVSVGSGYDGGNAPLKFSGTAAQTFTLTGATAKYDGDIEVNKTSNTVSLGSDLVMDAVGQDLTMTSGTFSTSGTNYALTVAGNVIANGGTLTLNGSTVDLNGDVTVAGGTVSASTGTMTVAGTFTRSSGTFTHNSGTVNLDGTNQQIVGAVTFGNLTKIVTSAATLTFPASTITTVVGTLNLQGADNQALSLRSSSGGVQATITPTTVTAPNYLDIQDIYITVTTRCITTTQECVDSGNNTGWTFRNAGSVVAQPTSGAGSVRSLRIISPNGGEEFIVGERVDVTWTATGGIAYVNIYYSDDGGDSWETLETNYLNTDTYAWTADAQTTQGALKVEGTDTIIVMATDTTDATFTVLATGESSDQNADDSETTDEETSIDEDGSASVVLTPEQEEEAIVISKRLSELPTIVTVHGLVKLPNDGNPLTEVDSAVYYVGADGKRHAFPNAAVYFSWFCDFSGVKEISATDLAALEFGENITYRPGYKMVKFQTSPKVYAVDHYGVLRWVATEEIAVAIYGDAWVRRIDDVSDAFFGNYAFGTPILEASDFDSDAKQSEVVYPSDNMSIPGYVASSPQALVCDE